MREMVGAGKFYERDPMLLKQAIDAHYNGKRGPGALPLSKMVHNVRAIIVPNSPYKNCGDCMAWAYKEIAESPITDLYIILAVNQSGSESGLSLQAFQTPLGIVRTDQEFANSLAKKGSISINETIHAGEHAIEVQLPFLEHAKELESEHLKILPVLISSETDVKKLALDIKETIIELKRNPIFIVSVNFTHYGPLFHYVPFMLEVEKNIYDMDKQAIDFILKHDIEGFVGVVQERNMTIQHNVIELLLRIIKPMPARLEQYYTSGDILKDYKNSVSYASIIFEEKHHKETGG